MDDPHESHGCHGYDPASALFGMHLAERLGRIEQKLDRLLSGDDLNPEEQSAFDLRIRALEALSKPPTEKP